jgi:hypothetical protein
MKNSVLTALTAAAALSLSSARSDATSYKDDAVVTDDVAQQSILSEISHLNTRIQHILDDRTNLANSTAIITFAAIALALFSLRTLTKMKKLADFSKGQLDAISTLEQKLNSSGDVRKICELAADSLKLLISKFKENERGYLLPLVDNLEKMNEKLLLNQNEEAAALANKILGAIEFIEAANGNEEEEEEEEEKEAEKEEVKDPVSEKSRKWNEHVSRQRVSIEWLDKEGKLIDFFRLLSVKFTQTWSNEFAKMVNVSFRQSISTYKLHPDQTHGLPENEKKHRETMFKMLLLAKHVLESKPHYDKYISSYQYYNNLI